MQQTMERPLVRPKRRSRVRDSIIEATKQLLGHYALSNVTLDDVLREAQVARSSFYNHFASLDALISHTVLVVREDLYAHIRRAQIGKASAADSLARGVVACMRYGYDQPASAHVLMYIGRRIADPESVGNEVLTADLKNGIKEGVFEYHSLDVAVGCVRGIALLGLSRMLDLHHEYSKVRDLTKGICAAVLLCLGVDKNQINPMVEDAMKNYFDIPPVSRSGIL